MRYSFYTQSGARYVIDEEAMTWKRDGSESTQEIVTGIADIAQTDGTHGTLASLPDVHLGHSAFLRLSPRLVDSIVTTPVTRLEQLA